MTKNTKYYFIPLLAIFVCVLQTSFFFELFGIGLNPNFFGAFVAGLALNRSYKSAYMFSIAGGVLLDILKGSTIGVTPVVFSAAILIYKYVRDYYLSNSLAASAYIFGVFYLYKLLEIKEPVFSTDLLISSAVSVAASYLLSWLFTKIYEKSYF